MVKINRLDNCIYMPGNVPNVRDYLSVADVFLLPSSYEGHPISLVEAYYSNLPCVVYDSPGINDFFPDTLDSLVYAKNKNELSEKIVYVIHTKDEIRKSVLYRNSCEYVKYNFSSMNMVNKYIELLNAEL